MERTAVEDDYLFGAAPVIYRDARRLKPAAGVVEDEVPPAP